MDLRLLVLLSTSDSQKIPIPILSTLNFKLKLSSRLVVSSATARESDFLYLISKDPNRCHPLRQSYINTKIDFNYMIHSRKSNLGIQSKAPTKTSCLV